jgi:hypothetical protein
VGRTEEWGKDNPPGPVCLGVKEEEAKAEDNSRGRHKGRSFFPFVFLIPQILSQRVQCVTGRERLGAQPPPQEPVLSSEAQVLQWAMSSVCPAFVPTLPQGMVGSQRGSHPQGQLGGQQGLLGRRWIRNRKGT